METPKLNIYLKISKVMEEVSKIKKSGYNNFNKYEYMTEEDVLEIRPKLIKHGLVILPSVLEERKDGDLTILKMNFRMVDAETSEVIDLPWVGYGSDKQDKGGYKAMTGALKFFLAKTFLLPSGNDPENETKKPKAEDNLKKGQIIETIARINETKDKATLVKWQTGIKVSKIYTEPQKNVLLGAIEEALKKLK